MGVCSDASSVPKDQRVHGDPTDLQAYPVSTVSRESQRQMGKKDHQVCLDLGVTKECQVCRALTDLRVLLANPRTTVSVCPDQWDQQGRWDHQVTLERTASKELLALPGQQECEGHQVNQDLTVKTVHPVQRERADCPEWTASIVRAQ